MYFKKLKINLENLWLFHNAFRLRNLVPFLELIREPRSSGTNGSFPLNYRDSLSRPLVQQSQRDAR